MKTLKRPTINDIATLTGSSIATVSRVLNGTNYPVSDEKRQLILAAAAQLDYTPNGLSKALKMGKSREIGVLLPSMTNPYYAEVVSGIETACYQRGYNPVLCSSNDQPDREQEHLEFFLRMRMEGIIVSTIGRDGVLLGRILRSGMPATLFDQPVEHPSCDSVTYNFFKAGQLAAEYLLGKGHKEIAFLTLPFDRQSRTDRFEGFLEAFRRAEVPFLQERLLITQLENGDSSTRDEFAGGRQLARQLMALSGVTAVVAINDLIALGVMNELIKNGLRVPQDISVVGFDDIAFSGMSNPPLATVKQPSFALGRLAALTLIDRIEHTGANHNAVVLQPQLIERESVCNIK